MTIIVILVSCSLSTVAINDTELNIAYGRIIAYANNNNIDLGMTLQDFYNNYNGELISDFENSFYASLSPMQNNVNTNSRSGGEQAYYYNTGYSCPTEATYGKYNLLDVVQKGDIIFEANGGFGITGHIAIVDSFPNRGDGTQYIRIIEAILPGGVVYSILDDKRVDDKDVTILRVTSATGIQKGGAVTFCREARGAAYNLDFAKDTSDAEIDWYCSELVWAAYLSRGIDIETTGAYNEPGITPRDIRNSALVSVVSFSTN